MAISRNWSLPGKFALMAFIIAGIGILGTALFSYQDAASLLRQQSVERISGELHRLTIGLKESVERMRFDARRIARSDAVAGYNRAVLGGGYDDEFKMAQSLWKKRIQLELSSLLEQRPEYLQIRFIGIADDGMEIVRVERNNTEIFNVPENKLQRKGQYDYVRKTKKLLQNEQFVSEVELNREFGRIVFPLQPVVRAAAPVYASDGKVFGVVVINVDFDKITSPFLRSPKNVAYIITDNKGDYLFHRDKGRCFTRALGGDAGLKKDYPDFDLLKKTDQEVDYRAINLPDISATLIVRYLYYDPLDPSKYLLVGALTSHTVIDQQARGFGQRLMTGVILVVIILSIAMAVLAAYLLRPIQSLTDAANRIASGDDDTAIPVINRADELGLLAKSFNTMLAHLNQSRHDLRELADSLEEQVKERTLDLQAALEKAEVSAKIKSEFLATMSHEIRTPMNGVLGMLDLLAASRLNKEQQHRLKLARNSANALLNLINDILDFSKVEAGKLELEIIDFDLRAMLGDFAEAMAVQAQKKGLEVILDIKNIEESMVKGDPGRIRQLLTNLVGNSIKFTEQGNIVIFVELIQDVLQKDQVQMRCKISDTGIGIPADKIEFLFDSFSQVDSSTTRKYGGTGLGLAIVKKICTLMGGDIKVSSEEGKGSCFEFDLYLQRSKTSQIVMPKFDVKTLNLLVVDDNAVNREVLCSQLEHWGISAVAAENAETALNICEQRIKADIPFFDIALLDMQMPVMDGAELGRKLKANRRFKAMKLVMMTSMNNRGDARFFADMGFSAYFPKPATTQDLFGALAVTGDAGNALEQAEPLITHHYLQGIHMAESQQKSDDNSDVETDVETAEEAESYSWPEQTRILLVEDNKVNQLVAKGILKNLGLSVEIANNGQEALDLLNESGVETPYTLVLMDCQMPVLDGYEASSKIRSGGAGDRYLLLPVIAMTANSMAGDREKCLLAGMSDYLSKPVDSERLLDMLCKWIPGVAVIKVMSETPHQQVEAVPANTDVSNSSQHNKTIHDWDKDAALKRFKGESRCLLPLIELFLEDMPQRMEELQQAIKARKMDQARIAAHTIKGVAANLSGLKLQAHAAQIEVSAKQENGSALEQQLPGLLKCYQFLVAQLQQYQQLHTPVQEMIRPVPDNDTLEQLLQPVLEKLQHGEYIDNSELESLQLKLPNKNSQELLNQLLSEIAHFDTQGALKTMNKFLNHLSTMGDSTQNSPGGNV